MRKVSVVGINDCRGKKNYIRREYQVWADMLRRCYSDKCQQVNPTYKGVLVCKRWHTFSSFLEDVRQLPNYDMWLNNPNQRIALDKEFYRPSKVYCKKTCGFNTMADNNIESNLRNNSVARIGLVGGSYSRDVKARKVRAIDVSNHSNTLMFESTRDSENYGYSSSSVSRACRGLQGGSSGHLYKGYYWEYV